MLSKESIQGKLKAKEFLTHDHVKALETGLELYAENERLKADLEKVEFELIDKNNFLSESELDFVVMECKYKELVAELKAASELQLQALIENQKDMIRAKAELREMRELVEWLPAKMLGWKRSLIK